MTDSLRTPPPPAAQASADAPIAFFDGECGLCNGSVRFLLRRDRHGRLRFADLRGQTAAELLPLELTRELETMVLRVDGELYSRSTAVLRATVLVGGFVGGLARLMLLVPRPIRDVAYRWLARNRKRLGAINASCSALSAEEASRFLP